MDEVPSDSKTAFIRVGATVKVRGLSDPMPPNRVVYVEGLDKTRQHRIVVGVFTSVQKALDAICVLECPTDDPPEVFSFVEMRIDDSDTPICGMARWKPE